MALDPHPVGPEDVEAYIAAFGAAFGKLLDDEDVAYFAAFFDPDFGIGVSDRGRLVATTGSLRLDLTLPAGPGRSAATMVVPGVTTVGVVPTHRRRGLLTAMMRYQLSDYRDKGYPLAILTASEGGIYRRFGYGAAQFLQSVAVDRSRAACGPTAAPAADRMWLVDPVEAAKLLPDIHDRARRVRPGELARSELWWEHHLKDPEKHRDGGGTRAYAVHESAGGDADGWVSYRYYPDWNNGLPRHRAEVHDLVATEPAAVAALWRFLLNLDLVGDVTVASLPLDDPLRWLLSDGRQARTTHVGDHVWVRIIDVAGALAARGYGAECRLVLEVTGDDPASTGRFVLDTGLGAGSCRQAKKGEKADLVLGLAELGAIYLGGVRPSELAAAGLVREVRPGASATADQAFAAQAAPFCSIDF